MILEIILQHTQLLDNINYNTELNLTVDTNVIYLSVLRLISTLSIIAVLDFTSNCNVTVPKISHCN